MLTSRHTFRHSFISLDEGPLDQPPRREPSLRLRQSRASRREEALRTAAGVRKNFGDPRRCGKIPETISSLNFVETSAIYPLCLLLVTSAYLAPSPPRTSARASLACWGVRAPSVTARLTPLPRCLPQDRRASIAEDMELSMEPNPENKLFVGGAAVGSLLCQTTSHWALMDVGCPPGSTEEELRKVFRP